MIDTKPLIATFNRIMHLPPEESVKQIDSISNSPTELLSFIESISKSSTSPDKSAIIHYAGKSIVKYCRKKKVALGDVLEARRETGEHYQTAEDQLVKQTYAETIRSINSVMGKRMARESSK
jgi:hypothetical protein